MSKAPFLGPSPLDEGGGCYEMSLIESNVRVDERLQHHSSYRPPGRGSVAVVSTVCVRADEKGPYALTAADLASIESNRTREKLKTKADHVRANSEEQSNRLRSSDVPTRLARTPKTHTAP